jgi:hypothetical protein
MWVFRIVEEMTFIWWLLHHFTTYSTSSYAIFSIGIDVCVKILNSFEKLDNGWNGSYLVKY